MQTIKDTQRAWLAGIVDGEGSFVIFRRTNISKNKETIITATASITITNSNKEIIDECANILDECNIKYWMWYEKDGTHLRRQKRISVRNYGAIIQLINLIEGDLIGKKDQANLMKTFVDKARKRTSFNATEDRLNYCVKMSELNKNGNLIR